MRPLLLCAGAPDGFWEDHNLAITLAAVLFRQPDQSQSQGGIVSISRLVMQGAARQANHPAGPSLRRCELLARMDNSLTQIGDRQALGFK